MKMSLRGRLSRSAPVRFIGGIAIKCWAYSGAYILFCIVLYWLYGGVLAFLLLCFATTGVLYQTQDQLLYRPDLPEHSRVYVPAPSIFKLPYQSVYTRSRDGTMLHMFFIVQPGEKAKRSPTILFLHGNAGNIGHRLKNVFGLYHNADCNVLMLEYRGYGLSEGSPSEEGLYMDAQAGIDFLTTRNDINTSEIIVFGRSLGGAVAIDLATKLDNERNIWCLILENTFTSIPDMASILVSSILLNYLPLICYKNQFMSVRKVRFITVPTMFMSGLSDKLVPPHMMKELHKKCGSSYKRLISIVGGTHNETWNQDGYYQHLQTFINELRQKPALRVPASHVYQIDDI
ncbi:alpha/beta hydrolase domain-containing protein 13 [Fopius arisanus]|uniref:Alpha/beta hydrolase domain-containing protein 13 n=1 Tax=Fopius arisanus TaxID=64838 RepID=A0A9R1SYE1_9HYME|nr:PREDICTED: alpha/beta hydrolase domain-containing protein 13 [Fopius arisanus]